MSFMLKAAWQEMQVGRGSVKALGQQNDRRRSRRMPLWASRMNERRLGEAPHLGHGAYDEIAEEEFLKASDLWGHTS